MNDFIEGQQFHPQKRARAAGNKTGTYGGSAPAKSKRYDTATNSFRGLKPKVGKIGQGVKGAGSKSSHHADDGVGAKQESASIEGAPGFKPHMKVKGHSMSPKSGKVGQGSGLNGKGHAGAAGPKFGSRVG